MVEAEIRASRERFANLGAGIWALLPKDTNILAGFCGFRFFHDPPELQLLYGLAPSHWSGGLATEASRAVMRYAFEDLGFAEVVASTDAPNAASIRVMERLGMKFEKWITTGGLDTVYYKIERERFRPGGDFYEVHP